MLMIPGCGQSDKEQLVKLQTPVVVREAPIACPKPPASASAEARRGAPRPPDPDLTIDGRPKLSDDAMRGWVDSHELAIDRKNGVIRQLVREAHECRGDTVPHTTTRKKRSPAKTS